MVLFATIIPYSMTESESSALYLESLKVLINASEVLFLNFALNSKNQFTEKESTQKIFSVALSKIIYFSIKTIHR